MTAHRTLLPSGWPRPKGYANGISARGRMIFTGGVVGWDEQEAFVSATLAGQFRQVLANTLAILAEGGAGSEHVVRMTWYVTSRDDITPIWKELMGSHYPAIALVEVKGLVNSAALVEIEATAVVPE